MRPTVDYLIYYLKKTIPEMKVIFSCCSNAPVYLKTPLMYTAMEECVSGGVYFCNKENVPSVGKIKKDSVIICAEETIDTQEVKPDYTMLTFPKHVNLAYVWNTVQNCYEFLRQWGEDLEQCVQNKGSVQELLEISQPIFGNPLSMTDAEYCYVAYTPRDIFSKSIELFDADGIMVARLSQSIMRDIKNDTKSNHNRRTPFLYNKPEYGLHCIMLNIHCDNIYIGSLGETDRLRRLEAFDYQFMEYLGSFINRTMREYNAYGNYSTAKVKAQLVNLLNHRETSFGEGKNVLKASGLLKWKNSMICCISAPYVQNLLPQNYICYQLESLFPGALAVSYESVVVLVLSLEKLELGEKEVRERLDNYLNQNQLIAGMSNYIHDFYQLHFYYLEAVRALEFVMISSNEKRRSMFFRECAIDYIMNCISGEIPTDVLCSDGVKELLEHDKTSTVSYCKTLLVYLEYNMNASQAAKYLYIQRNTFMSRLERIKIILDIDLEDPQQRLYILLSLKLLMREGLLV